ncbi:cytoplasmic phosphatidylinositol transfer protein 1 [Chrysoperla carnea]|uniref:cytoplasmic phosphatidylinositol transfer protein 1 n=1 Tax=Chrysoperla carnea TaxID=189513 RepID=UPI001D077B06|nr:cytoplasmic phosphatidylinositol transfer protein 1 [Chrysoperla carnea]XP_044728325.1 cytoplasmic phosphatidylinositol transfer protein 1 [Chrysoperla carnea]
MGLSKEYRICMPLTVEEYHVGQLYMIARHSHEQSNGGEGVEFIESKPCEDEVHGQGQFTEKRIHLSSRLPTWVQSLIPKIFYVTEKAWNYYPYTITEYTCSFLPRFSIFIETRYEDNNGCNENCLNLSDEKLATRSVVNLDIAYDNIDPRYYKEEEDPCFFQSRKTGRGPLIEGWQNSHTPIMCSYKLVTANFEVWGLQTRVEEFIQSCIQNTLLIGHRQAFVWIDEWIEMSLEDVRQYEKRMFEETNVMFQSQGGGDTLENVTPTPSSPALTASPPKSQPPSRPESNPSTPSIPTAKSWFSWS